jgi:hypothetical protein
MGSKPTPAANPPVNDLTGPFAGPAARQDDQDAASGADNGARVNAPATAQDAPGGPPAPADPTPGAPGPGMALEPAAESHDLDLIRDEAAAQAHYNRRTADGRPEVVGARPHEMFAPVAPAPMPDRPTIPRATIDEAMARRPDCTPPDVQAVSAVPHVQRAAVAMDQVAHRSDAALRERGYIPADVHQANAGDFDAVELLTTQLEDALGVVRHLAETTRGRVSAAPSRPPGR